MTITGEMIDHYGMVANQWLAGLALLICLITWFIVLFDDNQDVGDLMGATLIMVIIPAIFYILGAVILAFLIVFSIPWGYKEYRRNRRNRV